MSFFLKEPQSKKEFEKYYNFRWLQLRKPLGGLRGSEIDNIENDSYHIMAINSNSNILGVGRIHSIDNKISQIRYMAVEYFFQKEGIGSKILFHLENKAKEDGKSEIILHARELAIKFYIKNGYKKIKKTHKIMGEIQHFLMQKRIK